MSIRVAKIKLNELRWPLKPLTCSHGADTHVLQLGAPGRAYERVMKVDIVILTAGKHWRDLVSLASVTMQMVELTNS